MSQWTMADIERLNAKRGAKMPAHVPVKSKYRNVKTTIGTQTFDSKREADYWRVLQARQQLGEIHGLHTQVRFGLNAAVYSSQKDSHEAVQVAEYVADFVYADTGTNVMHVVDAKGKRTQMYALKKKWLELQSGIIIEEV